MGSDKERAGGHRSPRSSRPAFVTGGQSDSYECGWRRENERRKRTTPRGSDRPRRPLSVRAQADTAWHNTQPPPTNGRTERLTRASLILIAGDEAAVASAGAVEKVPLAVRLADVFGRYRTGGTRVRDAMTGGLHYRMLAESGRSLREPGVMLDRLHALLGIHLQTMTMRKGDCTS